MWLAIRHAIETATGGLWGSLRPTIRPLDLGSDGETIDALLDAEEWPFTLSDLEASEAQPRSVGLVAEVEGKFAGFFTAHHFGDVGYLDMMIIAPGFRGRGVARPLYFHMLRTLRARGMRGFVVHTTQDSARLIRLLGFKPGAEFVLLRRTATPASSKGPALDSPSPEAALDADAQRFGLQRKDWFAAILGRGTRLRGTDQATACLRPRRGDILCLDGVGAEDTPSLRSLIDGVVHEFGQQHTLDCFARVGSPLEAELRDAGFTVPDFFPEIGPLTEWRRGKTSGIGDSQQIASLDWL